MKKILVLSVFICLIMLSACGHIQETTTPNDTTPGEDIVEIVVPDYSSCLAPAKFFSIEDLDTYMTTGSVDPADYSQEPSLLRLIPLSTVQERGGYLSLMDLFDFGDESLDVEVFVLLGEPTGIRYIYYFEHATILIDTTEAKSASEYLMAQENSQTVAGITSIQSPAQSVELANGYVSYTDGDFEVIYGYQQNEKVSVQFVLDGFSVQIGITKGITPAEDVRFFLNDSSYSKLHPLFSTDEQALTSALNEIRGNLSKADLPTE